MTSSMDVVSSETVQDSLVDEHRSTGSISRSVGNEGTAHHESPAQPEKVEGVATRPRDNAKEALKDRQVYDRSDRSIFGKIPNEFLARIFAFLVQEGKATGDPTDPLPEVTISHVCGRWRRLALSMPKLWNFFHFDGTVDCYGRIPQDRLDAYLERSQSKPFDIWFNLVTDHEERWNEKELATVFLREAHRLRLCRMQSDDEGLFCELSGTKRPAPMLQALSMVPQVQTANDRPEEASAEWIPDTFKGGAPRLRYVHLDDCSVGWFKPPLDSVVHLRLETPESYGYPKERFTSTVFDSVISLPRLESLSIRGTFFELDGRRRDPPRVQSVSLKHFRCNDTDDGQRIFLLEYFLSNVSAPALRSITLEDLESRRDEDEWVQPKPDSFPSVNILALRNPELRVNEMRPLFAATPTIRHLIWSSHYDCWPSIRAFPSVLDRSGLLPLVEQVTIDGSLMTASEGLVRRKLASAFPKLATVKVRETYAEAVRNGEAGELGHIAVTAIQPTEFPLEGWIADPGWIEVGDGAFSGWEYYDCLDLD